MCQIYCLFLPLPPSTTSPSPFPCLCTSMNAPFSSFAELECCVAQSMPPFSDIHCNCTEKFRRSGHFSRSHVSNKAQAWDAFTPTGTLPGHRSSTRPLVPLWIFPEITAVFSHSDIFRKLYSGPAKKSPLVDTVEMSGCLISIFAQTVMVGPSFTSTADAGSLFEAWIRELLSSNQ